MTPLADPQAEQAYLFDSLEYGTSSWKRVLFFARGPLVVSVEAERERDSSGGNLSDYDRVPAKDHDHAFGLIVDTIDKTLPAS